MTDRKSFSANSLKIDPARAVEQIDAALRDQVFHQMKRKGAVVAMSGGIDSSVVAALCVHALGKDRVLGLFLPEEDSSGESLRLGRLVAESLGIQAIVEDIAPVLRAVGCYERRDAAIRAVLPEYGPGYKNKIALPNLLDQDAYPLYSVIVESPSGVRKKARLTAQAYLEIVAATNFKQRTRKMFEYYHADRMHYAVAGTPNRLEYDQGFFVKNGDGAADFKPIAHLFKCQVYQLADFLKLPLDVRNRQPTTDTYSLEQSQEEFYFALPLAQMDICIYGKDHGVAASEVATATGLSTDQVERVYRLIDSKRRATKYMHMAPLLVEPVPAIDAS